MKKILTIFALVFCCAVLFAQQIDRHHGAMGNGNGQMPNLEKFLQDRITFVTHTMQLSPADSVKFVPVYKEKLKAKAELMMKSRPYVIMPNQEYPDSVYTGAAMAEAKYKLEDAKLDMDYLKKFQKILTPKQVFSYQQAEKMFVGSFMHGGRPGQPRGQRQGK